jgi:hypothetical protein
MIMNDEDKQTLSTLSATEKADMKQLMGQISEEFATMDESRETIKDLINAGAAKFKISKPILRRVARFLHKKNMSEHENALVEVKNLYSQLK